MKFTKYIGAVAVLLMATTSFAGEFSYFLAAEGQPQSVNMPHPLGGVSAGTIGYINFCNDHPDHVACKGGDGVKDPTLDVLKDVNVKLNHDITFVDDIDEYGVPEHWQEATTRGDCEDIALAKMSALSKMGYSTKDMRLAMAFVEGMGALNSTNPVGHVVLLVDVGDKTYLLDNRTDVVDLWTSNSLYNYRLIQVPGTTDWVKF